MATNALDQEPQRSMKAAADAKKSFDKLIAPATADAAAAKGREGYDDKARNDLERLLDATSAAPKEGAAPPEAPEKKQNE